MRFIFGLLVGYSIRGKEKSIIIVLATIAFIVYIVVPTVILSVALFALSLDVHHERRSRPVLAKVPAIKGLSYEEAEIKLHASNMNIRLLATRYDLPLQPELIIDQVPQPGEEVVYCYPIGVTITKTDFQGQFRAGRTPTVPSPTRARNGSASGKDQSPTVGGVALHRRSHFGGRGGCGYESYAHQTRQGTSVNRAIVRDICAR